MPRKKWAPPERQSPSPVEQLMADEWADAEWRGSAGEFIIPTPPPLPVTTPAWPPPPPWSWNYNPDPEPVDSEPAQAQQPDEPEAARPKVPTPNLDRILAERAALEPPTAEPVLPMPTVQAMADWDPGPPEFLRRMIEDEQDHDTEEDDQ
jgi:hypothetical protein